ncbi:MAG: efflux RND transporter periplasmic adaptor subunit, partial [Gallionella sp.]
PSLVITAMRSVFPLAFLALVLSACSKEAPPPQVGERPALTQVVGAQAGTGSYSYSGEIRARHEVAMGFRIGGKVTQRLVDAGARVKAGQVLARLDGADAGLQVGAADAQYQLALAEVKRYRLLVSKNFVSQSALDTKEAALKALSAQAGLAGNLSSYTSLVADKAGIVTATLAEAGQVVAAGQAVLRVAQDGEREVAIAIPESQYVGIKVGMKAEVVLWSELGEDKVRSGQMRELSPAADTVSRTYAARIALDDDNAPLGMTAQVRLATASHAQSSAELVVPLSALFQQGEQIALWIVAPDHSVSLRPVQIASYRDDGAVIRSGIVAGERIVSAGVHKLYAGEKIKAIEARAAEASR